MANQQTNLTVAVCMKCLECRNMAERKINNVNVISDPGAVGGVIITAVDTELWSPTDSHLRYVRHQIVWRSLRVLTNTSGLVGTNRVEVPQQHGIPVLTTLTSTNLIATVSTVCSTFINC